jgi:hypothetical protein
MLGDWFERILGLAEFGEGVKRRQRHAPGKGKRGVVMREPHPEPSFVFKCEEAIVAVAKLLRADPVARELEVIAKLIDGLEKPEDVAAAERIHFALVGLAERVQKWRDVFAAKQK